MALAKHVIAVLAASVGVGLLAAAIKPTRLGGLTQDQVEGLLRSALASEQEQLRSLSCKENDRHWQCHWTYVDSDGRETFGGETTFTGRSAPLTGNLH